MLIACTCVSVSSWRLDMIGYVSDCVCESDRDSKREKRKCVCVQMKAVISYIEFNGLQSKFTCAKMECHVILFIPYYSY